jgi:lipid-binding SYLF domain-containing protein
VNMKRYISFLAVVFALVLPTSSFADARTEQDRLQNAARVMQEVLDIPDDIPQDLLNKARCVVVMPSVLKAAFVVGGSYGRGAMVCRTGKDFAGPCSMAIDHVIARGIALAKTATRAVAFFKALKGFAPNGLAVLQLENLFAPLRTAK